MSSSISALGTLSGWNFWNRHFLRRSTTNKHDDSDQYVPKIIAHNAMEALWGCVQIAWAQSNHVSVSTDMSEFVNSPRDLRWRLMNKQKNWASTPILFVIFLVSHTLWDMIPTLRASFSRFFPRSRVVRDQAQRMARLAFLPSERRCATRCTLLTVAKATQNPRRRLLRCAADVRCPPGSELGRWNARWCGRSRAGGGAWFRGMLY